MRIGMVLDGHYPSDIRVRKEAESLAKLHDVFVLCNRKGDELSHEEINNVKIIRAISYKSLSHKGIIDVITTINFIHPYFKKILPNFIKENKIEVLHVHDLPLAKTVYKVAKKHHVKTVLDLHENYPAALLTWFSWRKSPIIRLKNKIFFSYARWSRYESKMIHKYDILIAVVDEMKQRLIEQHQINENKIVVVPNSEKKEFADNFNTEEPNYFNGDRFVISYVGGFGPHRGLHTAIQGMKEISKKIPNALLVLVGPSNNDVKNHLNAIVIENKLEKFVEIRGSVPFEQVTNIMKSSQINIIPHISNEHTESAVPHKFYQILLSGKPLLVSDCAPMKRLIETKGIGSYFQAENYSDFSQKVIEIEKEYDEAIKKSKEGYRQAFNGELNWEYTSTELLKLYNTLKP